MNEQAKFQLSLLANGLDFVLGAAERAAIGAPRDLKYAMLNLVDGVELLVKARLEQEHWTLLFDQVDKASQEKLRSGDFKSVDFEQAYRRLKDIVGVEINAPVWKHLNDLRTLRNRTRHYNIDFELDQVRSLLAECLNFCHSFCNEQFPHLADNSQEKQLLARIWEHLVQNKEFVDARMRAIAPELKGSLAWECPACWQVAVIVDADDTSCKFCGILPDATSLAEHNSTRHSSDLSDPIGDLEDCPECGMGKIAALILAPDYTLLYMCSFCGEGGSRLVHCVRCGALDTFTDEEEPDIRFCESCIDDIRRQ